MYTKFWLEDLGIGLKETEQEAIDWIHLAQNREQWFDLRNTVMNILVSLRFMEFLY
jgi:hypothetical protein